MTNSPNTQLFGPQFINDDHRRSNSRTRQNVISPTIPTISQPFGRYGARNTRPQCSMAQVII